MNPELYLKQLDETGAFINKEFGTPEILVILGSGLGAYADSVSEKKIPFSEIPHFPVSSVQGHTGHFHKATIGGKNIGIMQGRVHLYEGIPASRVVFGLRACGLLGTKILINTNAAGGLNKKYSSGSIVTHTDLITLFSENPSIGVNHPRLGDYFWDMSTPYDSQLLEVAKKVAKEESITLHEGIFFGHRGPAYETAADIRFMKTLGADVVAMSTVPEVLAANQMQMRVLGLSLVTNLVAGISDSPLSHEEVLEAGEKAKISVAKLINGIIKSPL